MNKSLYGYKNLLDNKPKIIYFIIIILWMVYLFVPNTVSRYEIPENDTLQIGNEIYTRADGEYVDVYNSIFSSLMTYNNVLDIVRINYPEMVKSLKLSYMLNFAMFFIPLILYIVLYLKKKFLIMNFINLIISILTALYISFYISLFPVSIVKYYPFIGYYLLYGITLFSLLNLLLHRIKFQDSYENKKVANKSLI